MASLSKATRSCSIADGAVCCAGTMTRTTTALSGERFVCGLMTSVSCGSHTVVPSARHDRDEHSGVGRSARGRRRGRHRWRSAQDVQFIINYRRSRALLWKRLFFSGGGAGERRGPRPGSGALCLGAAQFPLRGLPKPVACQGLLGRQSFVGLCLEQPTEEATERGFQGFVCLFGIFGQAGCVEDAVCQKCRVTDISWSTIPEDQTSTDVP